MQAYFTLQQTVGEFLDTKEGKPLLDCALYLLKQKQIPMNAFFLSVLKRKTLESALHSVASHLPQGGFDFAAALIQQVPTAPNGPRTQAPYLADASAYGLGDTLKDLRSNAKTASLLGDLKARCTQQLGRQIPAELEGALDGFTLYQVLSAAADHLPTGYAEQLHRQLQSIAK